MHYKSERFCDSRRYFCPIKNAFQQTNKFISRRVFSLGPIVIKNHSYCLRPYRVENTGSRPISEVKQRRAWLVLWWVTTWEPQVLLAFALFLSHR